jgi:hypothetical protein
MPSATFSIAANANDGWTGNDGFSGWIDASSTAMYMGHSEGNFFDIFMRFANVTIPAGSTINSATIKLRTTSAMSGGTTILGLFKGVKQANPTAPTTWADKAGRPLTTASTSFSQVATYSANQLYSHTVTSIIQEIINQGGWASGNALMLYLNNNGTPNNYENFEFASLEHASYTEPQLDVTWTVPTTFVPKTIVIM